MNRWGMGTMLYRATILYVLLAIVYDAILLSAFCGRLVPAGLGVPAGAALCGLGLIVYWLGTVSIYRAIHDKQLATRGIYAVVRHPLYAAWVWCLVPGAALMLGTPLALAAPVVAAVFCRLCIPLEEAHLLERFGRAYLDYSRRVGGIAPRWSRA